MFMYMYHTNQRAIHVGKYTIHKYIDGMGMILLVGWAKGNKNKHGFSETSRCKKSGINSSVCFKRWLHISFHALIA